MFLFFVVVVRLHVLRKRLGVWGGTGIVLGSLSVLVACGDDGVAGPSGDGESRSEEKVTHAGQSCDLRRFVVFDVFGVLTMDDRDEHEVVYWIQDPGDEPEARPGSAELAHVYRNLGYELLYLHTVPEGVTIGDVPFADAIATWLERNDFPLQDGADISGWGGTGGGDGEDSPSGMTDMITKLLDMSLADDVDLDVGYTNAADKAEAFKIGGIATERIFTLAEASDVIGTTAVSGDNLEAHVHTVETLVGRACEPPRQ